MVVLHVKKGDESQFLYETTVTIPVDELISQLVPIFNGRLKVNRICAEIEELAEHGITMPPNMQGLTDDQIVELKLVDEWAEKCEPSGGHVFNKDDIGRRNGRAPNDKMKEILKKTVKEAKDMISKKKAQANEFLPLSKVQEAVDILRGAVTIVYPMGLPPHDPIKNEFENDEDLSGTQASLEILDPTMTSLWWASKEMQRGKLLADHIGKNEKTKIICKLQKKGQGAPAREPVVSEDEQKKMMAYYHRKQEEFKKLKEVDDDSFLDSSWATTNSLKQSMHGIGSGVKFRPGGAPM